jgi:hypothetical protein
LGNGHYLSQPGHAHECQFQKKPWMGAVAQAEQAMVEHLKPG